MQLLLPPAVDPDAVVRPEILLVRAQLRRLDASMGIATMIYAMDMFHAEDGDAFAIMSSDSEVRRSNYWERGPLWETDGYLTCSPEFAKRST